MFWFSFYILGIVLCGILVIHFTILISQIHSKMEKAISNDIYFCIVMFENIFAHGVIIYTFILGLIN
jgi:hypothetical protein